MTRFFATPYNAHNVVGQNATGSTQTQTPIDLSLLEQVTTSKSNPTSTNNQWSQKHIEVCQNLLTALKSLTPNPKEIIDHCNECKDIIALAHLDQLINDIIAQYNIPYGLNPLQ